MKKTFLLLFLICVIMIAIFITPFFWLIGLIFKKDYFQMLVNNVNGFVNGFFKKKKHQDEIS